MNFNIFYASFAKTFFDKFVEAQYRTSYLPTVSDLISRSVSLRIVSIRVFYTRLAKKTWKKKNKFIDLWRIEILFCIPPTTILDLRYHIYLSNSRPNYDSQLHTTLQISIKTEIFYFQLIFTPIVRIFLNSNQNLIDIFSHISVDANKFECG